MFFCFLQSVLEPCWSLLGNCNLFGWIYRYLWLYYLILIFSDMFFWSRFNHHYILWTLFLLSVLIHVRLSIFFEGCFFIKGDIPVNPNMYMFGDVHWATKYPQVADFWFLSSEYFFWCLVPQYPMKTYVLYIYNYIGCFCP
jgi:hypothetical protein